MFFDQDIKTEMIIVLVYFRIKFYKKVQRGTGRQRSGKGAIIKIPTPKNRGGKKQIISQARIP